MAFEIPKGLAVIEDAPPPPYTSGFTPEEEDRICKERDAIMARDLTEEPVTLEEFKKTIVPWYRIHRTQEFILHPEKVKKVRVPKEAKAKVPRLPKPKKLTKAQRQNKLQGLVMKIAMQQEFTQEELEFYKEETGVDLNVK